MLNYVDRIRQRKHSLLEAELGILIPHDKVTKFVLNIYFEK